MAQREKYRVIRKIDAGGMAEVFQGVAEGIEGFTKKVAIKRVLPHLVENKKFIAMFLDEARLSLRMNHANVVHVFDIGEAGGTYFIVMEFVDGTNLKRIMEALREKKTLLPVEQSIYMIMEVCRGLSYAHELSDSQGQNLGIVHRDVSPPNILLSKQGEVKIVDFGLAKATSQLESTDPGVVKGKFAYLSPEAAWGKDVDLKADVFACGIVLFELLTGQRLFLGKNDVSTIELVRKAHIPSIQQINPNVKPELERIVRKALAADTSERYPSCDEFAEELANYLFSEQLKVTSFDIRRTIASVISKQEREQVAKPSIIDQLIQEELGGFASIEGKRGASSPPQARVQGATSGGQPLNPFGFEESNTWNDLGTSAPSGGSGQWRESGLFPKNELEQAGNSGPSAPVNPVSLEQMLEGGETRSIPAAPAVYEEEEDDDRLNFVLGLVVAMAVVGLIIGLAWFLGFVP